MRTLRSMGFLMLFFVLLAVPMKSFAQFSLRITVAPPELVIYTQPVCPQDGYLWTPGYWAYGPEGYFWVPGTWVEPPTVGYLWTPGYWGWGDGVYAWNEGYWGPEVGFYGGVNYGYGYGGIGYEGGYWRNNQFSYNTYVNNVGPRGNFHNTYNKTVIVNTTVRVSYNGGSGGITTRPNARQQSFAHAAHSAPTSAQSNQQHVASQNHEELASVNHGSPAIAATSKPGEFSGNNVVPARGARAGNTPSGNGGVDNKPNTGNAAAPGGTQNRPNDNGGAVNRATNKNAAEIKPSTEPAAAPVRATPAPQPASQPSRNSGRSAQPAPRADTGQPSRVNPSPSPAQQQAPAPRGENAPRPAAQQPQQNQRQQPQQQQQRQQPQAQQHQAAPRTEDAHPGDSKSGKPDGR